MMRHERGFSLVELMVAMTVTLVVSGAIYGLLTVGGNAFRREPEVADRQQNIRAAMDLISRDVYNAGAAVPPFGQVFTVTDPAGGDCTGGLDGCGMAGAMGPDPTDVLEMVGADERCPAQTMCCTADPCTTAPGTAAAFTTREETPACMTLPGLALITSSTGTAANDWFVIQPVAATSGAGSDCVPGGNARNGNLTMGAILPAWPPGAAIGTPSNAPPPSTPVIFVYPGRVVRYRVAPAIDPTDTAPALWRSETGRYRRDGTAALEPGNGGFPDANTPWELVARGIEDLQVEYFAGAGPWADRPPTVTTGTWNTLVRSVRITLSARTTAANLQGVTTAGGTGPDAVRGQLSTVVTPRAAFGELQMGSQIR